jgi:hypothetical protein
VEEEEEEENCLETIFSKKTRNQTKPKINKQAKHQPSAFMPTNRSSSPIAQEKETTFGKRFRAFTGFTANFRFVG